MALSSLSASNMLGELGRLASWLKGDCVAPQEYAGLAVTEKVYVIILKNISSCTVNMNDRNGD